jgi:hypothetical protein
MVFVSTDIIVVISYVSSLVLVGSVLGVKYTEYRIRYHAFTLYTVIYISNLNSETQALPSSWVYVYVHMHYRTTIAMYISSM